MYVIIVATQRLQIMLLKIFPKTLMLFEKMSIYLKNNQYNHLLYIHCIYTITYVYDTCIHDSSAYNISDHIRLIASNRISE